MEVRLEISGPVPNTHTPYTFELEITVMHGDADSYDTFTLGPFKMHEPDRGTLHKIIEVLDRLRPFYPNGRGGNYEKYGYQNVPGYDDFFAQDAEYQDEWPYDQYGELQGTLDKYEVFYYDMNRVKCTVEVVK
jgi:hypothetical protein